MEEERLNYIIKICRGCECHLRFGADEEVVLGRIPPTCRNKTKAKESSRGPEPM